MGILRRRVGARRRPRRSRPARGGVDVHAVAARGDGDAAGGRRACGHDDAARGSRGGPAPPGTRGIQRAGPARPRSGPDGERSLPLGRDPAGPHHAGAAARRAHARDLLHAARPDGGRDRRAPRGGCPRGATARGGGGMKGRTAIAGLGMTEMGKVYGRTATDFAAEALALALDDAGLAKDDVDGLLVNANHSAEMAPMLQMSLGLEDLTLVNAMSAYGSSAGTMLQYAAHAITAGQAGVVACVYADAPLSQGGSISQSSYSGRGIGSDTGFASLRFAYGDYGPANTSYALACRRHMHLYGTTHDQLGTIAVGQRAWAQMNPHAQMHGKSMTLDDYHASRWIVEPLHLLDCCLVSNGAVAVIVTSAERALDLRQPPVYLLGFGQAAPGDNQRADREPAVRTGAKRSGELALRMADVALADIDVLELYDCYTYTVLVTLEDYGFCEKGEGGALVADGKLAPGGALPCNTGGGQLSGYYMWGFTPLSEAVIQARGQAGERQVEKNDIVLASGNGGVLNFHSTAILSKHAA